MAVACFGLVAQVAPGTAQTTQEKLNRAEAQVEQIKKELARQQGRLELVQREINAITIRLSEALRQREAIQEQMQLTEGLITKKERREGRLQGRLNARARDVYMNGPIGTLEFVLTAESLGDLSDRISFLDALSRGDVSTAAGVELVKEELQKQKGFLGELQADLAVILEDLQREAERIQEKWEEQAAIKASIEDKLAEAQDLVKDLEKKYQRELLALLPDGVVIIKGKGPFETCPVAPPRSYIDDFGFPRVGHTHQGNDIFAPLGTPILAPFDGTAEEGLDGLGGTVVHVYASASADYVYNAHLSKHAGVDGQHVEAGTIIGFVGNTGNAAGTPYHDHFEYHPGGGSAISPYPFLNVVCGVNGSG